MSSIQFTMLPAPEILKNDMECLRFNEAIRLVKIGQFERLTDVAYALNFSDQSHFIRDIKAFSGMTPTSLSQQVDDFLHEQAGYASV